MFRGSRYPDAAHHREWFFNAHGEPGTAILWGEPGQKWLPLCRPCWGSLLSERCLTHHLGAEVGRMALPRTQAQECALCPGYEALATLLQGRVYAIRGVPGAFIVRIWEGPAAHADLVIASERLGRFPAITNSEIAALRLPVVCGLRIVEAPGGWPEPPRDAPREH